MPFRRDARPGGLRSPAKKELRRALSERRFRGVAGSQSFQLRGPASGRRAQGSGRERAFLAAGSLDGRGLCLVLLCPLPGLGSEVRVQALQWRVVGCVEKPGWPRWVAADHREAGKRGKGEAALRDPGADFRAGANGERARPWTAALPTRSAGPPTGRWSRLGSGSLIPCWSLHMGRPPPRPATSRGTHLVFWGRAGLRAALNGCPGSKSWLQQDLPVVSGRRSRGVHLRTLFGCKS